MVQQVQGQRGFEAWDMIVRRYDQRNTSDRSSAYAALINNGSERDRAKDVEQFDDILRNLINTTNKYEGRFGKIRDEELLIVLENTIRQLTRAHPWRSAWSQEPMARKRSKKGTEKHLKQEPKVNGVDERVPAGVYRNTSTAARVKKERIVKGKGQWSKTRGKKGGKGQEKSVKGDTRVCRSCGKARLIAANCTTGSWNRSLNDVDEDKGDINDEVHEDEDELHAWCLLEESENEQWQEVISKNQN